MTPSGANGIKDIDLLAEPERKPLVVMKDERFQKQIAPDWAIARSRRAIYL
jgi:hypothetical protein